MAQPQETSGVGIASERTEKTSSWAFCRQMRRRASSKAIHVGDRIIAVAQENRADVRIKGLEMKEVVGLVRGPKGTSVRLTIVPAEKDDTKAYVVIWSGVS